MENINIVSIVLEVFVVLLGLMIALGKKQAYGWGLAFTFFVYVFYDLARTQSWQISNSIMIVSFLAATVSAVIAVYSIYKKI
ncbi:MAG: hypothetical protein PHN69_06345 [Candidatus Pacebacteria bacterium]|nr:hypothetical protein [Candidatus Paceibacterota bacterium]